MQNAIEYYSHGDPLSYSRWDIDTGHSAPVPELLIRTFFEQPSLTRMRGECIVVDLGSGPGTSLRRISTVVSPKKCIAVDGVESMLMAARAVLGHRSAFELETQCKDLQNDDLDIASASVDIVMCSNVMQFIQNLKPLFSEASRILKPGGVWGFNLSSYTCRQRKFLSHPGQHMFLFSHSYKYVETLLSKHSLKMLSVELADQAVGIGTTVILSQNNFVVQKI